MKILRRKKKNHLHFIPSKPRAPLPHDGLLPHKNSPILNATNLREVVRSYLPPQKGQGQY